MGQNATGLRAPFLLDNGIGVKATPAQELICILNQCQIPSWTGSGKKG
jgi:hypothetical protein